MGALLYYLSLPFIYGIALLPFPLLYVLSDAMQLLLFGVFGYRLKVVRANLRNSFPEKSEAELKALTLFELGYPLGAHIDVLQRGDALDITDACVTKTVFAFDGDHEQMHRVTRL